MEVCTIKKPNRNVKLSDMERKLEWVRMYISKLSHNEIEEVIQIIEKKLAVNKSMGTVYEFDTWMDLPMFNGDKGGRP